MSGPAAMRIFVSAIRGECRRGGSLSSLFCLSLVVFTGCGRDRPAPVQSTAVRNERTESRSFEREANVRLDRRMCIMVIPATGPLTAARVTGAVSTGLAKRGIESFGGRPPDERDLVILVRVAVREGAVWGGIPSREVLLESWLFDVREQSPLATASASARVAERSPDDAAQAALKKASEKASDRIVQSLIEMPVEYRTAPPNSVVAPSEEMSLACLPFHNGSGRKELDGWCKSLASIAASAFQRSGRFQVKERARLSDLVGEQDVVAVLGGQSDAAKKLGSDLEVSRLLVGEIAFRPDGALVVTARLVRVDDSGIEQVIVVAGSHAQVERLESSFQRRLDRSMLGWIAERMDQVEQSSIAWPTDDLAPR
ncbi:hypothetical protein B7486_16430 [cyanobacterium TDX16]|nr:hypothetical protein B7486_16430 [cyanobacterium TDX16]